jgi:hypothetical protein
MNHLNCGRNIGNAFAVESYWSGGGIRVVTCNSPAVVSSMRVEFAMDLPLAIRGRQTTRGNHFNAATLEQQAGSA